MVIATQNPIGAAGTQLLPDSQMDRFMIKLSIGYPNAQSEVEILLRKQIGNLIDNVNQIISQQELEDMKREVDKVYISTAILEYIVKLVSATRDNEYILWGASPRASLALASMSKAEAFVQGRDYVIPEDIQLFFYDCIGHRIKLTPEGEESKKGFKWVLDKILNSITPPSIK